MNCNGFRLRPLNQDCNRIAVKSSIATTWAMTYRERFLAPNKKYEVGMDQNELIVISFQDGSGGAAIEITPLGDNVGTMIAQSSRGEKTRNGHKVGGGTATLRVGTAYRFELEPGESLVLRSAKIVHPNHMGAGLSV
jgi:hypothetical protein